MQVKSPIGTYQQIQSYWKKESAKAVPQANGGQAFEAPADEQAIAEEAGVIVELSNGQQEEEQELTAFEQEQKTAREAMQDMERSLQSIKEKKPVSSTSPPQDKSGALTRRLVAAISQMEIHQVISEANESMISLRVAAATGDKDTAKAAKAIIRKMEKLIRRGHRKVADLNKEDGMRQEQTRAEKQQKKERAEQIKKELREQIRKRKEREKKYLREEEEREQNVPSNFKLDAATEAQIEQQAQMQATMEAAAPAAQMGAEMGSAVAPSGGGESGAAGMADGAAAGGAEGGEATAE